MKNLDKNFWKSKNGGFAIIAITYFITFALSCVSLGGMMIICMMIAFPTAGRVVEHLNNAVFGNLFLLFGPLSMFFQIFLIKLLLRFLIAFFCGIFIAPYVLGKIITKKIRKL